MLGLGQQKSRNIAAFTRSGDLQSNVIFKGIIIITVKVKDKGTKICIAPPSWEPHPRSVQVWITYTAFTVQMHHHLPLSRKRSPDGARPGATTG